jgi:hypothetical protein
MDNGNNHAEIEIYNSRDELEYNLHFLYQRMIVNNLFLNEPAHSIIYRILLMMNKNEFFIKDLKSKELILNMRDQNNENIISKSYKVYLSNEIVIYVIKDLLTQIIEKFETDYREVIVLSIIIFILRKSLYNISDKITEKQIENLLDNYHEKKNVTEIASLIGTKYKRIDFINKSLIDAFENEISISFSTYGKSIKQLFIPTNLPKKILTQI